MGIDLFIDAMTKMLTDYGLQREATFDRLLEAFENMDGDLRKRFDRGTLCYRKLPRQLIEQLKEHFMFVPTRSQQATNDKNANTGSSDSENANQVPSGSAVAQRPASGEPPPSNTVSDEVLLAAASAPVLCAASCLDSMALRGYAGQKHNFVAIRHPNAPHVFLKLSLEMLGQTEVQPTHVPLIFDRYSGQDIQINGQNKPVDAISTIPQGPRMAFLVTRLGEATSFISEMVKIVRGVLYLYDMLSQPWLRIWGN